MCPERTLEGDAIRELNTLPQIIGSDNQKLWTKFQNFMQLTNSLFMLTLMKQPSYQISR